MRLALFLLFAVNSFAMSPFLSISHKNIDGGFSWKYATLSAGANLKIVDAVSSTHTELVHDISIYYLKNEINDFQINLGADHHAISVLEGKSGNLSTMQRWGLFKIDLSHNLVDSVSVYSNLTLVEGSADDVNLGTIDIKIGFRYQW